MTIEGADGAKSPPLPFVEVEDGEAEALIALYPKSVEVVSDELLALGADVTKDGVSFGGDGSTQGDAEAERQAAEWAEAEAKANAEAQAEEAARLAAEPVLAAAVAVADGDPVAIVEGDQAAPAVVEGGEPVATGEPAIDLTTGGTHGPADDMADALDLIEADDLVKTGPRAGRPKVNAVADILGRDTTAEEIDAAWAAHKAAE